VETPAQLGSASGHGDAAPYLVTSDYGRKQSLAICRALAYQRVCGRDGFRAWMDYANPM
jgi:hypothetical protein